jgi:hypothetical protein
LVLGRAQFSSLNESVYEELGAMLPRNSDSHWDKLLVALEFLDGWIDSHNHDWHYYEGIVAADWPQLARRLAQDLRDDREIEDERVLRHFKGRHPVKPGLWERLTHFFRRARCI